MTVNQCIQQLLEIEEKRNENLFSKESPCFGLARVGQDDQLIVSGTMEELLTVDFGFPLHCVIIPENMHFIEKECFELFRIKH